MIFQKGHIKVLLITIVLFSVTFLQGFSQGTDISGRKLPLFYIGLSTVPSQIQIINKGTISGAELNSNKAFSISGDISTGVLLTNNLGLSVGIGYSSYSSSLNLASYENLYTTTDSESESYERRITGTDITENQKISFLNIPILLNIILPFKNNKMGFYFSPGINLALPMEKSFNSSGVFTFKGYYPQYNVLLENLPQYGFGTDISNTDNGDLELKSMNLCLMVSTGMEFFVSKKMQITAGLTYLGSLSTISEYSNQEEFHLSTDAEQMATLMGGAEKTGTMSIGLKVSLRYYLK